MFQDVALAILPRDRIASYHSSSYIERFNSTKL